MRQVGPFREYTINSSDDRIKCVRIYLQRLFGRDFIPYRECVEFIAAHKGDIQFVIDSANYDICLNDFATKIAPSLMVFLDNQGISTSMITEDVYKVGRAWTTMKLREEKSEQLSELYATTPKPTPDQISQVLREGDPLKKISESMRIKPEKIIFMCFEGITKNHGPIYEMLDNISCYLNADLGNYIVKILPATTHVDVMNFADRIYSCF